MYAVHFGAYQDPTGDGVEVPTVYGYADPEGLHQQIHLGDGAGDLVAYLSGSWACWGPADNGYDEATGDRGDGDDSIHIVVNVPEHTRITPEYLLWLRWAIYDGDPSNAADYRLLDHAIVSDSEDWSQQTHVVLFRGNPEVSLYAIDRKGWVA